MDENVDLPQAQVPVNPKVVRYFVHHEDDTLGPYTLAQLQGHWRRRKFTEEAKVCVAGSEEWMEIASMKDRLDFNPVDRHFTTPVEDRKRQRSKRRAKRGSAITWLVVLGIVLAMAIVAAIIYFAGVAF